mgnify:FL=1
MVYFWNFVLLVVVFVETAFILLGKETVKQIFKNFIEEISGMCNVNFIYGLYDTEANDFIERVRKFFQSITLSNYMIDQYGWIQVTYIVNGIKIDDRESVKQAIRIEVHSYLQEKHGVNYWGYYIPVFTNDTVIIKIAASQMAKKQFQELHFNEKCKQAVPMEEENFHIDKGEGR